MPDFTSLWVSFQKSQKWWGSVLLALLFFIAGFQVGKITSPYYAANPIIFQDSNQDKRELVELRDQGAQQQVAGTKTASPSPSNEGESEGVKKFVASINSNLYHLPDCPSASRIKVENQIWFASPEEAAAAGYSPSKCTQDKLE